jgi:hypothetical protein
MEEETKGIMERFEAKCVQYDALERELCGVKEALKNAWETIKGDEKVREEAKESQVKCCVLEEQIEVGVSCNFAACKLMVKQPIFGLPTV